MAHRLVLLYEVPSSESGAAGEAGDAVAGVAERAAALKSVELRIRLTGLEVSLFDGSATALASSASAPRGVAFVLRGLRVAATRHPSAANDIELAVKVASLQLRVQSAASADGVEGGGGGTEVVRSSEDALQPLVNAWLRVRIEPSRLILVGFHTALGALELFLDAAAARTVLSLAREFLSHGGGHGGSGSDAPAFGASSAEFLGSIATQCGDVHALARELSSAAAQPSSDHLLESSALQRRLYVEQFAFEPMRLRLNVDASAIEELAAMFGTQLNVAVLTIVRRVMTSRANVLRIAAFERTDTARIPWSRLEDTLKRTAMSQVIRQISLRVLDPTRLLGIGGLRRTLSAALMPSSSSSSSGDGGGASSGGTPRSGGHRAGSVLHELQKWGGTRGHALALPLQPPAPPARHCSTLFVLFNLSSTTLALQRATVAGGQWISTGVSVRSPPAAILPGSFGVWQSSSQVAASTARSPAGSTVFGTCLYDAVVDAHASDGAVERAPLARTDGALSAESGGAALPNEPLAIVWCNGVTNVVPVQEVRVPVVGGSACCTCELRVDRSLHAAVYIIIRDVPRGRAPPPPAEALCATALKTVAAAAAAVDDDDDLAVWLPLSGNVDDVRYASHLLPLYEAPTLHPPASFGPGRRWRSQAMRSASDVSSDASPRVLPDAVLALALRGEGGGVTLPARSVAALPSGNASRTIAVWAQLNLASAVSDGGSCCLWSHGMFGSREVLAVVANVEQRVWEVHVSAFGEALQTSASLDSAWHHHCLVHDGAVLVYYIDGYEGEF